MTYTLDTAGALEGAVATSSAELATALADRLYEVVSTTNAYFKQGGGYLITCLAKASLVDGEKVIVTVGDRTVTYELDVNGTGVASGNIQVDLSPEVALAEVADKIAVAIAANQSYLSVTHNYAAQVIGDTVFIANANDTLTAVAHGMLTGDGAVRVSNAGGALPGGLAAATDYYVIRIDNDTFYLATTRANAYAGTRIDILDAGTGVHTLADVAGTTRSAGTITVIAQANTFTITETVANASFTTAVTALTAAAGGGSAILAAGVPRLINGRAGKQVAVVRVTVDGRASITPIQKT